VIDVLMSGSTQKLLIAGGGTGGHIFPGIAIAEEWIKRGGEVVFVGTPLGKEGEIVPKHGFELKMLKVGKLKGGGILRKIKTLLGLPLAFWRARKLVKELRPNVVLGVGGYASGPACMMARFMGIFTAIIDQNVQPGLTNRILGKFANRVYISFTKSAEFFSKKKVLYTGNAVRSLISTTDYVPPKERFCILIYGGSQGAVAVNRKFLEAIERLKNLWPKLEIYHQAGKNDLESIKEFYAKNQIQAEVKTFYDNINELYEKCHLVVCRAGAGTLTELALSGRPAILIPYPYAADDHQKKNAEVFIEEDAAWMMEQKDVSAEKLAELIQRLYDHPEELIDKARNAKRLAKPQATSDIVEDLLRRGNDR